VITKLIGMILLVGSLGVVYEFESASSLTGIWRIFHWPALVLTGIGPLGLILMCTDRKILWKSIKMYFGPSPLALTSKHEKALTALQEISQDLYTQGVKPLENLDMKHFSPLFRRTVERLSVKMPTKDIRDLVRHEKERAEMRLSQNVNFFALGVRLAPSVGMLGTILGMVRLLSSLQDPAQIGSHMGLALLTTFYGLFFSLAIWTPIQQRMERLLEAELFWYDQVIHYLELLEARKPAQYFADLSEQAFNRQKKTAASK